METALDFEKRARIKFSKLWRTQLQKLKVNIRGVTKEFDMVATDMKINKKYVGDVKKLNRSNSTGEPDSGERSFIAEYVWLLQHCATGAHKFIVFGNDRDDDSIAAAWIRKYYPITQGVHFYFLTRHNSVKHWVNGQWTLYNCPS